MRINLEWEKYIQILLNSLKIKTSYFYQIRNFTPNMIPVSTAISDPDLVPGSAGKEYYIDKRGIINGLRYEPLIVQKHGDYILVLVKIKIS